MFKTYKSNELDSLVFEIKNNKAVIIPTDTVMGILANNENIIYQIKNRPRHKKIIKFILDVNEMGSLDTAQIQFVNKFWPGGVTIVKNNVSYRMPNDKYILYLLSKCGSLYCSSANISNMETIKDSSDVIKQFDEKKWYYKLVVLDGKPKGQVPSTIVNVDNWTIIREGDNLEEIKSFINDVVNIQKKFIILYDDSYINNLIDIQKILEKEKYNFIINVLNENNVNKMCDQIINNKNTFGIILTSEVNEWDIIFNKHYLIRSAIIYDEQISYLSRNHDDANVAIFDFKLFDKKTNLKNITNFIFANFEGGRHYERVKTIIDYEKKCND